MYQTKTKVKKKILFKNEKLKTYQLSYYEKIFMLK